MQRTLPASVDSISFISIQSLWQSGMFRGSISYGPSRANLSLYWSALSPYEAEEEANKPEPRRHCIQEFPLQTRSNISLLNSPLYLFKLICIEKKGNMKVDVSSMECIPFPANKWVYKINRGNLRNALNCFYSKYISRENKQMWGSTNQKKHIF